MPGRKEQRREVAVVRESSRGGARVRERRKKGDAGKEGEEKRRKEKKRKRRKEKKRKGEGEKGSRDPKEKEKGLKARWEGTFVKRKKMGRVAARGRGVGGKEPGQELGFWRLGGLGPGLGYSLSILKTFFFILQNDFSK